MDHWHVTLDGYGERDRISGDIITKFGEIISIWSADAEDHCSFTPSGETAPIIWEPFLGIFCKRIAEWHEKREAQKLDGDTNR